MHGHVTFLFLVAVLVPLAVAQPWQICGHTGNHQDNLLSTTLPTNVSSTTYQANSTYEANLRLLATTLPTNASSSPTLFATSLATNPSTSPNLFASATVGAVPDQVSALALCRGDINASSCLSCVTVAFKDAQQLCPYDKDVTITYDPCLLRISNQNFLASTANSEEMYLYNGANITRTSSVDRFDRIVSKLLNATADYAAANTTRRFATGEVDFDANYPQIYGMAQCTPDLTPAQCRGCLGNLVAEVWRIFPQNTQGVRIVGERCNLRAEVYSFYNGAAMLQIPAEAEAPAVVPVTPAAPGGKKISVTGMVLEITLPIVAAILAITAIYFCFLRRRLARKPALPYATNPKDIESIESFILDLSTLRVATNYFAESNKLGEGGFGAVYKGALPDGQEIAVKRLSQSSGQGIRELKNELVLVAKLQHKNLVRLVGVCLEEQEKLLVYEYMPNRSLDTILFDSEQRKELDWGQRFKIINGIARGLQYLHEDSQLKIVHRDLKASNVLLDSDMNPKISDFGLARLFGWDQSQEVTSRVVGTYGYMAPEYAMRGHYSIKSDVFSFGVLMLEIVTGRRNSGSYNSERSVDLSSLIWEHWTMGTIIEMMDPSLSSHYSGDEMLKCIHIGLMCVQENPADRPMMSTVDTMLSSNTVSLQAPSRPAFCFLNSGTDSDVHSEPY